MIPNILTTVRLFLVPIFAYLLLKVQNLPAAAVVLILSGATDVVDGYIARKFHMVSDFGKVYDPFVDKLMQITAVICLALAGIIPFGVILIVILKELTMIVIGGILYLKKIVVHSHWYGKATTVIFYTIIFILIIWQNISHAWVVGLLLVLVGTMLASAVAYLVDIIKNFEQKRVQ